TKVVLSIESARGVLNAYDMAIAAEPVVSLTFGGAQDGDLNTDLGCAWSIDGPEMLHARSHTLLAARAARFDAPLDGVFANVRDAEGFERDTTLSRRLGYRGRKLIHPTQIEPCNRLYRPSAAELDYYARVLAAFDQALARGSASTTVDGRMIDAAMANAARRVLEADAAWKKAGQPWEEGKCRAAARGTRALSFPGSAERRRVLFEQLDHGTGFGLVGEGDRDALAVGRAHAGDAPRLPIGLPEHMPDGRNLLHHGLVDP